MKIIILTNMPSPYQVDLFNKINHRKVIDIEVVYLRETSYGRSWEFPDNIKHSSVFLKEIRIWKHWYLNKGVFNYFTKVRADGLVVCQYAAPSYHIAMLLARLRKIPAVFWSESVGGVENEENPLLPYGWMRHIARRLSLTTVRYSCKEMWCIGNFAHSSFYRLISNKKPIHTLTYGSCLDDFMAICPSQIKSLIHFIFVGNLSERKGFHLLVSAVGKLMVRNVSNFHVTVLGEGPLRYSTKENMNSFFTFTGFVQKRELLDYFKRSHVLIFPSLYDGWGMSVIEGLAAGLPVLSTNKAGAATQAISHKINGYILEEISSECLANGMEWFIKNKKNITSMSFNAKKSAVNYDCNVVAAIFEKLALNCFNEKP